MRYTLENTWLKIEVESKGAELRSVIRKETVKEYMWQADPQYWNRTSPVLFPFVGGLKEKRYLWQGREWPMNQHGFARDMEFTLLEETPEMLRFHITDTEETYARFPFRFDLEIGYRLTDSTVIVSWKVTNPAEEESLHFSIGAHPAFNCPFDGAGYRLLFPGKEQIRYYGNEHPQGLADETDLHELQLTEEAVVITEGFFDRCTYIIDDHQTTSCGIADPSGRPYVMVRFDTPLFAIWSPEKKKAPFLCIEPWFGRTDSTDFTGTLEERKHGNVLQPGEVFEASYEIDYL